MITKLIGAATLFGTSAILLTGTPTIAATPLTRGESPAITMAGDCGAKDAKKDDAAKPKKDGSCGKDGSCSKDMKAKKDGSCGKDKKAKKDGSCGKGKKEGSCS